MIPVVEASPLQSASEPGRHAYGVYDRQAASRGNVLSTYTSQVTQTQSRQSHNTDFEAESSNPRGPTRCSPTPVAAQVRAMLPVF